MDALLGWLQQGLSWAVPFIILLGLLIFVHELGHFLVAKYFGVRVEVFSLGFGKKIFKFRRGDTDYCLSLIPFGGYVKMFGDDPTSKVDEDQKKFAFNHKPVGQRIAVVLAGPVMNFLFAIVLFILIAVAGDTMVQPQVGDVSKGSAAYEAGFRSGDRIQKVTTIDAGEEKIDRWERFKELVEANGGKIITVHVQRFHSEETEKITVSPKLVPNKNILSTAEEVGEIEGVSFMTKASVIGVSDPTSLASLAGLKTGDVISKVNGEPVERWMELTLAMFGQKDQSAFTFEVERGDHAKGDTQKQTLKIESVNVAKASSGQEALALMGIEPADLFISEVKMNTAAALAGLRVGDKITSINDKPLAQWDDLVDQVRSFGKTQTPLKVTLLRDGTERTYQITPQKMTQQSPTGKDEENYALGVATALAYAAPWTFVMHIYNPLKAAAWGFHQTLNWTKVTCLSFLRLVQNRVSAKSIGGPIMIGQLASETFKVGLSPFLKIMAIISINLFVLNLLPVPVLDGGHLLFFSIEAVKGSPLSLRKMEIAQQVGLVLLLALMVFALFNDISRVLGFHW
ncbi:MAG: RIP metalloprotease RseP [Bdellovibrionia bacterium]